MTTDLIVNDILNGRLDDHLHYLATVISERREELTSKVVSTLNVNDTVTFVNIKPKYMIGATGKMIRINRKRAVVQLNGSVGRFRGEITVPLNCLKKV